MVVIVVVAGGVVVGGAVAVVVVVVVVGVAVASPSHPPPISTPVPVSGTPVSVLPVVEPPTVPAVPAVALDGPQLLVDLLLLLPKLLNLLVEQWVSSCLFCNLMFFYCSFCYLLGKLNGPILSTFSNQIQGTTSIAATTIAETTAAD